MLPNKSICHSCSLKIADSVSNLNILGFGFKKIKVLSAYYTKSAAYILYLLHVSNFFFEFDLRIIQFIRPTWCNNWQEKAFDNIHVCLTPLDSFTFQNIFWKNNASISILEGLLEYDNIFSYS